MSNPNIKRRIVKRWRNAPDESLRHRLQHIIGDHYKWWDWGHKVMTLTGTASGGSYESPEPPTWYYRLGPPKRMARTGYPRHPLSTFEVVTDYRTFKARTKGLNEDEMYEWQAIGLNQDCELIVGHIYWGGSFYGMRECDVALLRRYLRMWRRLDWWGIRSWLYSQGLHAAVHCKKPRSCQETPPKGSGGYSHWYCREKRGHSGPHRFNNARWNEAGLIRDEPVAAGGTTTKQEGER